MAKVIMVKAPGPKLIMAAAIEYDEKNDMVVLAQPIELADGPAHYVPRKDCYELDEERMMTVNCLEYAAKVKHKMAELLVEHELVPVEMTLGKVDLPSQVH